MFHVSPEVRASISCRFACFEQDMSDFSSFFSKISRLKMEFLLVYHDSQMEKYKPAASNWPNDHNQHHVINLEGMSRLVLTFGRLSCIFLFNFLNPCFRWKTLWHRLGTRAKWLIGSGSNISRVWIKKLNLTWIKKEKFTHGF